LVDDLLDVSRITRGKIELRRQRVELADALARAIETVSPLLEQRRARLEVRVPRSGLLLYADPDRIAQVFSNLLNNAAKYSEPGSLIVVSAERCADKTRVSVKDEGVGIAPDMIPRVFDLFAQQQQTLDRARGGLGLGLTIVKSIVELHGGTVSAYSEGRGSTFTVELPLAERSGAGAESAQASATPQGERRGSRILVVDDNEDALEVLKAALEHLGYAVQVAHDGPSALEVARSFKPEIALLDIGLPVMDGYELAQRLTQARDTDQKLHLVAVTGYGQLTDRARSAAAGFESHLVKPVDLAKLERVVQEMQQA
jgi:CheY-like chemotaxis protein/two-component sensor histidine kinase